MHRRRFLTVVAGAVLAAPARARAIQPGGWRAGVAVVDITPRQSLWMAGFARRRQPSQGVALPLHAKALALQGGEGPPAVLVTVDLLGLTARLTSHVAAEARRRHQLGRADILFNASHTHCGPVVDEQLSIAYDLTPAQWTAIRTYTESLEEQLVGVIGEALKGLEPVRLAHARGEAGFARNRRVVFTPDGPVDRSVPVLRVDRAGGEPLAIVFGYACHNTTLQDGFVQYHGDYAGVAQAELERRHPGTAALFVAGCGADANPHPRGTLELVQAHGTALADAVDSALPKAAPIAPGLHTAYGTVELPFVDTAARARWKQQLEVEPAYLQRHAALMEAIAARDGGLPESQTMPVQVWHLGAPPPAGGAPALDAPGGSPPASKGSLEPGPGAGLTLVALGGEVVVDYALALAREYPDRRMWVAGYSNDVFGYVPSLRVLREGGYEGGDAMIYYGRPGPFTGAVEASIAGEVRRLMSIQAVTGKR